MPTTALGQIASGTLTKGSAPTSGTKQVETATVAGTVTLTGTAAVAITAAGMPGSPITVQVPVVNGDTATVVAGKIRAFLQALGAADTLTLWFTWSGTSTAVIGTANASAANDATMNISVDNGTCTGLTTAGTSANTTAGVRGDYKGAGPGACVVDSTNFNIYINTGDNNCPTWTLA